MHQLRARYCLTTPAFLAGCDQNGDAHLRVASLKGVLRFWWRALALGKYNGDVQAVAAHEGRLFGSTSGQASVLLRLKPLGVESPLKPVKVGEVLTYEGSANGVTVGPGARYLGYGLMGAFGANTGKLTRSCLFPAPDRANRPAFELILSVKPSRGTPTFQPLSEDWQLLRQALIAMGLFGGVGSRSRKGWGSLSLHSLTEDGPNGEIPHWTLPKDRSDLEARLRDFWRDAGQGQGQLPVYTAFSRHTDVYVIETGDHPLKLLAMIGKEQQAYRSWGNRPGPGNPHMVAEKLAEQRFPDDHDWAYGTDIPGFHPMRVVFGLPHNYYSSTLNHALRSAQAQGYNRRASPLFLHIQALKNNSYAAVAAILPAVWLPNNGRITGGASPVPANPDYDVIRTWIEGTRFELGEDTGEIRFPRQNRVIANGEIVG